MLLLFWRWQSYSCWDERWYIGKLIFGINLLRFFTKGSFVVLDTESLEEVVGFSHRKEEISDIKFSPGLYAVHVRMHKYSTTIARHNLFLQVQ